MYTRVVCVTVGVNVALYNGLTYSVLDRAMKCLKSAHFVNGGWLYEVFNSFDILDAL